MYHVGITGTQHGGTAAQLWQLERQFHRLQAEHEGFCLHQGDCIGVDSQSDSIYRSLGGMRGKIWIHPPNVLGKRAFTNHRPPPPGWNSFLTEVNDERDYLVRDRDIVDGSDELFALPKESVEPSRTRSGTWYTVRYARRRGRKISIIWPDGRIEVTEPPR